MATTGLWGSGALVIPPGQIHLDPLFPHFFLHRHSVSCTPTGGLNPTTIKEDPTLKGEVGLAYHINLIAPTLPQHMAK